MPSSYEGQANMNHCPNHLSCSFYVFKNLEKAPPPKSADCLHHCFQMEPPTSPRLPRPTSFFFMAEGPADVSWGVVVPARLISWLVGWLTLYLENHVMWIRTLMLFSEKLYTCLGEDPCLYGATLAMAFVSASKSRRATSNPGRQASTQLSSGRAGSTQQCRVAHHSCITVIPAGRQSLSADEKQMVYQDHFEL